MTTLNKALTRPAMIKGIPMVPFVLVSAPLFLLSVNVSWWFLPFLPLSWFVMKRLARKDPHIFSLLGLKLRLLGNATINRHYGATTFSAHHYENVDIKEFLTAMRLNQRVNLSRYIPYSSHVHENVVKGKDGDFFTTWELQGRMFECEDEENLKILTAQINSLIKAFEGQPITFYIHNIREEFHDSFTARTGNAFSDEVSRRYYSTIENAPFRANRIFFTVCYKPFVGLDKVERKRMSDGQKQQAVNGALQEMLEINQTLAMALSRFTATMLGMYEDNSTPFSSQLAFYQRLLTGKWNKVRITRTPFYETLGACDLFFSSDAGQCNVMDSHHLFRGLEILDYSPETGTGIFNMLLYAPVSYVATQSFTCMAKDEAQKHIKLEQKRLRGAEDDAISQQLELQTALDMLQSGHISFGKYHFSLMVSAPDTDTLIKDTNTLFNGFTDLGIVPTLATLSLSAGYFSQLPGVYTLRPRLAAISSQNFAELASLHNFESGKRDKNPWGESICILKTPSGGEYHLNLHNSLAGKDEFDEKNSGNASIIGTNGSGKTVLATFIQNMVQKYGVPESFSPQANTKRMSSIYFDKDRGAETNIRAMGGQYFRIRNGQPTGFNPFGLEPTKRNISFVKKLMRQLCSRGGQILTERDEKRISSGVDHVMLDLPPEKRCYGITRILENLTEPLTKEAQENGLRVRLQRWSKGHEFGWVFDNEADTFNPDISDNFGIDGTEFLDDKDVCAPITMYLLYRVTSLLDGRRLIIFMDEFWKWLLDPVFADFALNMLKVIRKLNGIFIPMTQSPAEILSNSIAPAIVEQCPTQIFMANPKASYKDYVEGLKVPPEIFEIIRNIDPLSHQFVVIKSPYRKGDLRPFAALVTLDLSGLGVYTKILSSSAPNLEIFDSIFKDGMAPEDWLAKYESLVI